MESAAYSRLESHAYINKGRERRQPLTSLKAADHDHQSRYADDHVIIVLTEYAGDIAASIHAVRSHRAAYLFGGGFAACGDHEAYGIAYRRWPKCGEGTEGQH